MTAKLDYLERHEITGRCIGISYRYEIGSQIASDAQELKDFLSGQARWSSLNHLKSVWHHYETGEWIEK